MKGGVRFFLCSAAARAPFGKTAVILLPNGGGDERYPENKETGQRSPPKAAEHKADSSGDQGHESERHFVA